MDNRTDNGAVKCRFGAWCRIEYGSDGFRQSLLDLAKETLTPEDVHFNVLAGGLISAKDIRAKRKELNGQIKAIKRDIKALTARNRRLAKKRGQSAREQSADVERATEQLQRLRAQLASLPENAPDEERVALIEAIETAQRNLNRLQVRNRGRETKRIKSEANERDQLRKLEQALTALQREMDKFEPGAMAAFLAKAIPVFTNAAGEPVNLYIVPSPAIDEDIGDETAHLLANLREDIRVYSTGNDRLDIKQANKSVEVLTPEKASWRSDYQSTPAERLLKDRRKQSARELPDFYLIGCFGSAILKPQGELPRPYVTVPVLHRLQETNTAENQIGVRVISVHPDFNVPMVRNYCFKDHVNRERRFIGTPQKMSKTRAAIIEELKNHGRTTAGILADATGVSADEVKAELQGLVITDRSVRKTWPGLYYDRESRRWDFDLEWVKGQSFYPPLPAERAVDSLVAYGCLHAGSVNTDYEFFLRMVPKIVLDREATILVGAGDFVEGIKHNLNLRGETIGGMNVTDMEKLAGALIAHVNIEVFRVRFAAAYDRLRVAIGDRRPTREELWGAISESLLLNLMILGNHDLWPQDAGITPLDSMWSEMVFRIVDAVEEELRKRDLCVMGLNRLVKNRLLMPSNGEYVLPSGLHMTMMHPHMARAKTTSLRPQEMLEKARKSHVVIGANFHVGEHIDIWEGTHGQRTCLELGTIKTGTQYEDNKLKIVDSHFAALRIESAEGRIIKTEATFYENDPAKVVHVDGQMPLRLFLERLGIRTD